MLDQEEFDIRQLTKLKIYNEMKEDIFLCKVDGLVILTF